VTFETFPASHKNYESFVTFVTFVAFLASRKNYETFVTFVTFSASHKNYETSQPKRDKKEDRWLNERDSHTSVRALSGTWIVTCLVCVYEV
jgi:hypothetical protein